MPRVAASERDAFYETRRDELTEAALRLWAKRGFDATSVESIARRAGISKGAFYLYFRVDSFFDHEVRDATAWCAKILEEQGVALVPGAAFGDDAWVRMSIASADEVLEDAIQRIAKGVGAA